MSITSFGRIGGLLLGLFSMAVVLLSLQRSEAILGIEELSPGMKGIGKTVFRGVDVESFDVEILDVLKGSVPNTDTILIRVGGKRIEQFGGICQGMSGSPIFVKGHMIGAIAFAEPLSDTRYGFVTPIKDMLRLFEFDKDKTKTSATGFQGFEVNAPYFTIPWFHRPLGWRPVMTPVMIGGLGRRAFHRMAGIFQRQWLHPMQLAGSGSSGSLRSVSSVGGVGGLRLEPGAAVGLQLMRGEVNVTALGTLTYKYGEKILALGHPFLQRGSCQMPLAPVVIHKVIKSLVMPFKIGSPTEELIGIITQDRERGVAGYLAKKPSLVALRVEAEDKDSGARRVLRVQMVQDPQLLPTLVSVVALDAMDKAMDRLGEGTCELTWKVYGAEDELLLSRRDLYYSDSDIASRSVSDLTRPLTALLNNELQPLTAHRLEVSASLSRRRNTARILRVKLPSKSIAPGERLDLTVTLQPYREAAIEKRLSLDVPKDYRWSKARLVVRGRGKRLLLADKLLTTERTYPNLPQSLPELLRRLAEDERNSELIVELYPPKQPLTQRRESTLPHSKDGRSALDEFVPDLPPSGASLGRAGEEADEPVAKTNVALPYVIEGALDEEIEFQALGLAK